MADIPDKDFKTSVLMMLNEPQQEAEKVKKTTKCEQRGGTARRQKTSEKPERNSGAKKSDSGKKNSLERFTADLSRQKKRP